MALANAVKESLRPSQIITWTESDGTAVDLTGATITGKIRDAAGTVRDIEGTLTLTDPENGVFTWAYHADDVETAGNFDVQFTATYVSGITPGKTIVEPWMVHSSL